MVRQSGHRWKEKPNFSKTRTGTSVPQAGQTTQTMSPRACRRAISRANAASCSASRSSGQSSRSESGWSTTRRLCFNKAALDDAMTDTAQQGAEIIGYHRACCPVHLIVFVEPGSIWSCLRIVGAGHHEHPKFAVEIVLGLPSGRGGTMTKAEVKNHD